ncbi:hypothetical protein ACFFMM_22210 [Micromonospora chaiyaphumensis]|uniref:Uncharacterized protein n=1 Tax=Micromonospora chaiyaphumensis TaxID=307119 RepID=A0A1C4U4P4_9ACTN|nr:hypothetical protein [Micromonospora chaiyaphumensis]SCE66614.1 hypothetical protein GA0070214_101344 [Micromonospora chaiyaphumensis]
MTRPEEPTEALPTRALPTDPGATVHLGPDAAAHLGGPDRPGAPLGPDATVHFGAPTVGVPGAAEPTVHIGRTPEPTVHLAGPAESTVHVGAVSEATTPFGAPTGPAPRSAQPTFTGPPRQHPTGPGTAAGGGPTAGAYREATADVRAVGGAPPPGELRFGPGVPATPPPAPAWPAVPPARRSRPVWRRVVSVLSTLLTAALLLVVGLYLWQRLQPLAVEGVTVAVPRPPGVACDVTVDVVATVRTNGRGGVIRYQWFRSDAPPGALLTERVGRGQRTATLTLKWTFSGVGATTESATVNIIEPSPVQAGTQVRYRCPGG